MSGIDRAVWEARFERGRALHEVAQYEAAILEYSRCIFLAPEEAELYYHRGLSYLRCGDVSSAASNFYRALKIEPGLEEAKDQLARAYDLTGVVRLEERSFDAALVWFNKCVELRPGVARFHLHRALAQLACRNAGEALKALNAHLALDPSSVQGLVIRAKLYDHYKNQGLAAWDMEQVLEVEPEHPDARRYTAAYRKKSAALFQEASQTLLAGKPAEALGMLTEAIKLEPDDTRRYVRRGVAYRQLGRYKEAIDDLREALERGAAAALAARETPEGAGLPMPPPDPDAKRQLAVTFNEMGVQLFKKGTLEKALQCFDNAAVADNAVAAFFVNRGDCRRALGDADGALADYRTALERDPASKDAPPRLAVLLEAQATALFNRGRYAEAHERFSAAIAHAPRVVQYLEHRAKCAAALGRRDLEAADYEAILRLEPQNTKAHTQLILITGGPRRAGAAAPGARGASAGVARRQKSPEAARRR